MTRINPEIQRLWPELDWIANQELRLKVAQTWELALRKSVLSAEDLSIIPFTLLVPGLRVSFLSHKRSVVHIARKAGETILEFYGGELPVDMDILVAGAILADVGKLLEYELKEGVPVQSAYGKYLRHPFSGVALAEQCDVPAEVCHIIATHAGEGDLVRRTTEATLVHHADFMTFLSFRDRLIV